MATKKHGFTLIELLVVLVIVAALAAILFPVFASVRHRACMNACASNLHQVSLALSQYAASNDNCYPPDDPVLAHMPHLVWQLLTPYTRSTGIFHCPDAWGTHEKTWGYNYVNGSWPYTVGVLPKNAPNPFLKAPRPSPETVVAWCNVHLPHCGEDCYTADPQDTGRLIIVRADGSTSQIRSSQVEGWTYHNRQWMPSRSAKPQPGDWTRARFPGDDWPPQD